MTVANRRRFTRLFASKAGGQDALWRAALVAIALMAFTLLVFDLDGQSMWNDEGLSVYRSRQPLDVILANTITIDGVDTEDTNPPLYFVFLAGWRRLAGDSVFALRSLGVLAALLNIPLIFQVARTAAGREVGLGAAFLLAISPFHVWQSQELRNYSFLLLFNLLSVFGLFQFLLRTGDRARWRWLVVWTVAGVVGIYTHYFGAFVFAFGLLALLFWLASRPGWRPSAGKLIAIIVIGLAGLPVLQEGLERFQAGDQTDFVFVPPHHLLSHAVSAFGVGMVHGFVHPLWRVAPGVLLCLIGMATMWRLGRRRALSLLVAYFGIPFAILILLSVISPIYNGPRHLYPMLPPFLILVAAGMVHPGHEGVRLPGKWGHARWLVAVLSLWLIGNQLTWLDTQFSSDQLVKDDLRGLADYLERVAHDDDLIVLHDTIIGLTFDTYYEGRAPWISVPVLNQASPEAAVERLAAAGRGFERVWFVSEPRPRTGFPRTAVSNWIQEQWPSLSSRRFPSLWLSLKVELYAPQPSVDVLPDGAERIEATWDNELTLQGIEVPPTMTSGSVWQPVFYWTRMPSASGPYKLSFRLHDELGVVWHQSDLALWPDFPPADWQPGEIVRYAPVIDLPAGVPPGEYQIVLRVFGDEDANPLPVDGQPDLLLSDVSVAAATAPEGIGRLPSHQPLNRQFGREIELVGFHLPEGEYRPGHAVPIDLFWRVLRQPQADYRLRVQLRDSNGSVLVEGESDPSRNAYPPRQWKKGELLRGQVAPTIPANVEDDSLEITLSLVQPDSGRPLAIGWFLGPKHVSLSEVRIKPWPLMTEMPAISRPLRAELGQPPLIEFHGYDLSNDAARPGQEIELTLYWRSLTDELTTSYTVFVHLAGEDEEIAGQGDGLPVGGFRPTTSWRSEEVIVDTHTITIGPDVEPDAYRLWVGLYDPQTNVRLPVYSGGTPLPDGRLPLTTVPIAP